MNEIKKQEKNQIIINALDGQVVTSSREIARIFDKHHHNVLRDIRDLIIKLEGISKFDYTQMFKESTWINSQNGQSYQEYMINRDGFTLLVMGFEGKKALEWKIKYINAFNKMEQKLKDPRRELVDIIKYIPKWKMRYIVDLYPEYFNQPDPHSLEYTSEINSSYIDWLENLNIDKEYITSFPTKDIYTNYLRYCHNINLLAMGKQKFYKTLEQDFNTTRRQKSNGFRYFIKKRKLLANN